MEGLFQDQLNRNESQKVVIDHGVWLKKAGLKNQAIAKE